MRTHAEDLKEIPGDESHADHLVAALSRKARAFDALPGKAREHRVAVAQGEVGRVREGVQTIAVIAAEAAAFDTKLHQLTRILHRQQPQHDLIHRVKIAVLAPIPRASDSTAVAVNPGLRRSWRSA